MIACGIWFKLSPKRQQQNGDKKMPYFYGSGSRGYIDSVNRQMSTSFYDNPERIKSRKRNQTDSDTKNEKSSNQNFIVKQQKEENDGNK